MARTALTEQRIEHIADMMRRLEWQTGKSCRKLAEAWGLSRSSLEKLSAAASKQVRAELGDPKEVTTTITAALNRVLREALADGDRRSVIRAAEVWGRVVGVMPVKAAEPSTHSIEGGVRLFLPALQCDSCNGRGEAEGQPCSTCNGTGHQSPAPAPYDPGEAQDSG